MDEKLWKSNDGQHELSVEDVSEPSQLKTEHK